MRRHLKIPLSLPRFISERRDFSEITGAVNTANAVSPESASFPRQ